MDTNIVLLNLAVGFGFLMAWGIGANDVSNAMGTSVGSKAITLKQAIVIAAIFEFLGALIAGSEVTHTIQQNIVSPQEFAAGSSLFILGMLSALLSAALWLLLASRYGLPVSTTHTIVGSIVGFGIWERGFAAVQWEHVGSMLMSWVMSPFLGGILAYLLFFSIQVIIFDARDPLKNTKRAGPGYIFLTTWIIFMISITKLKNIGLDFTFKECLALASLGSLIVAVLGGIYINRLLIGTESTKFRITNVETLFKVFMVFTAAAMAFAHGSNDVANAIGPVAAVAKAVGYGSSQKIIPIWILLLGAVGIVLGLTTYGHRVMATIGEGITQLTPARGFAVTLGTASTVVLASASGIPVSTTHTLVGGILGVGLARGIAALNLKAIMVIFSSWLVTFPVGGCLAILIYSILKAIFI